MALHSAVPVWEPQSCPTVAQVTQSLGTDSLAFLVQFGIVCPGHSALPLMVVVEDHFWRMPEMVSPLPKFSTVPGPPLSVVTERVSFTTLVVLEREKNQSISSSKSRRSGNV